ncbi:hypothetical protein TNCV_3309921 [Trichonephila clavipes]|nr:hypothetical protein TNCV_3309921 [Trichonephila clavipes]
MCKSINGIKTIQRYARGVGLGITLLGTSPRMTRHEGLRPLALASPNMKKMVIFFKSKSGFIADLYARSKISCDTTPDDSTNAVGLKADVLNAAVDVTSP